MTRGDLIDGLRAVFHYLMSPLQRSSYGHLRENALSIRCCCVWPCAPHPQVGFVQAFISSANNCLPKILEDYSLLDQAWPPTDRKLCPIN